MLCYDVLESHVYLSLALCPMFLEAEVEILLLVLQLMIQWPLEGCMTDCQSSVSLAWHLPQASS